MDHLMPGHGRLSGRAGHQEQSAHRDHPHHDVHLAGRRAVRRPGARARAPSACCPSRSSRLDVSKILYQLHLLPERRDDEPSALEAVGGETRRESAKPAAPVSIEDLLKEQNLELRRFIISTLDTWTHRIVAELRPKVPAEAEESEAAGIEAPPPPRPWPWIIGAATVVLAFLAVALLCTGRPGSRPNMRSVLLRRSRRPTRR